MNGCMRLLKVCCAAMLFSARDAGLVGPLNVEVDERDQFPPHPSVGKSTRNTEQALTWIDALSTLTVGEVNLDLHSQTWSMVRLATTSATVAVGLLSLGQLALAEQKPLTGLSVRGVDPARPSSPWHSTKEEC